MTSPSPNLWPNTLHTPLFISKIENGSSNVLLGFYQNCRGLSSKLDLFKCNVSVFKYIFVCLTETWLIESFYDNELGLSNYFIFRCDRNNLTSNFCRGSGVLIAIRNDILCKLLPTSILNVENLFVKFKSNNVAFIICSVYIPPNRTIHIYESFMSAVHIIISTHSDCVFLFCGNFNLPDVSWSNDNYGLSYISVSGTRTHCVSEIFAFHNFFN